MKLASVLGRLLVLGELLMDVGGIFGLAALAYHASRGATDGIRILSTVAGMWVGYVTRDFRECQKEILKRLRTMR